MKDEAEQLMKKLLFGLLMMFVAGTPVARQTVEQTGSAATQKQTATQTSPVNSTTSPAASASQADEVPDCGCEDKPLSDVLGVVNGVKITKQDLSPETRARVAQLQREVIEARQRELDLQIDSILLEAEA